MNQIVLALGAVSLCVISTVALADGPVTFINNTGPNVLITITAYTGSSNNCSEKQRNVFKNLRYRQPAVVQSEFYGVCWCWGYSSQFNGDKCGAQMYVSYAGSTIQIPRLSEEAQQDFSKPNAPGTK